MTLILSGTDGLSDVDGSAATPAIRGSDANTGIFFGTDIIGFSEGGVEAMRIDASGNVGIGGAVTNDGGYGRCLQVTGTEAALELKAGSDFSYVAQNGTTLQIRNNATAGAMTFATVSTERARFNATGALVFAGGTTTADGIGITFPATQQASSNANTLDDYEEGTFTPTAIGGSSAGTTTYTSQNGKYTKIGRLVTARFNISYSSLTGTGELVISLPFVADGEYMGSIMTNGLNWSGSGTSLTVYTVTSAATCRIFISGDDISWSVQQCVNESADFIITVTYFV